MTTHTDGEWEAHGPIVMTGPGAEQLRKLRENKMPIERKRICVCDSGHYIPLDEAEANARLIAAAGNLLEAAENALHVLTPARPTIDGLDQTRRRLRAAIAKAKGYPA